MVEAKTAAKSGALGFFFGIFIASVLWWLYHAQELRAKSRQTDRGAIGLWLRVAEDCVSIVLHIDEGTKASLNVAREKAILQVQTLLECADYFETRYGTKLDSKQIRTMRTFLKRMDRGQSTAELVPDLKNQLYE